MTYKNKMEMEILLEVIHQIYGLSVVKKYVEFKKLEMMNFK